MKFRVFYAGLCVLFFTSAIGFLFYQEQILFLIYGLEQDLINESSAESHIAYAEIAPAKKVFLMMVIGLSLGTTMASLYLRKIGNGISYYVSSIVLYVGLIISIVFVLGWIFSILIPSRIM